MSRRNDSQGASNMGGDGFLSSIKNSLIPSSSSSFSSREQAPPSTESSGGSYLPNPSALLVDLAPSLLSSSTKLLHPTTIASHQASLTSSSSSASSSTSTSLRRKIEFLRAGLQVGRPNAPLATWSELSTQLYLRDRVDDLLRLPVPPAPFPLSTSLPSTSSSTAAGGAIEAPPPKPDDPVPLYAGFRATIPAASAPKAARRRRRALLSERALGIEGGEKLGLKERGERARGLLGGLDGEGAAGEFGELGTGGEGDDGLHIGRRSKGRASKKKSKSRAGDPSALLSDPTSGPLESRQELERDASEVSRDMANLAVRRALVNGQMRDVEERMRALGEVRDELRRGLLGLREEELELEDELEGIQSRLARLPLSPSSSSSTADLSSAAPASAAAATAQNPLAAIQSSRRRKGPAFLPSEHDELPTGVAFMTLHGHLAPLLSLDITEPYGTLVSSSSDASVRLWDLTTGLETGFLKGHRGVVKALQVEGNVCVTGGEEGGIRVWDLERAEEMFYAGVVPGASTSSAGLAPVEEDVFGPTTTIGAGGFVNGAPSSALSAEDDGLLREEPSSIRDGAVGVDAPEAMGERKEPLIVDGPCMRVLDGHTKAVTSLYFDGPNLVTGSSDSTLRQWDLITGQCVQTMDILWAISNPLPTSSVLYPASSYSPSSADPFSTAFSSSTASPPTTPRKAASLRRQSSLFESPGAMAAPTTANYADGSWEVYDDWVGSVMFWGYALASGTKDGCVRMWDMRTGQAHRTLVGHTAPVTCLQFDEYHLISGSLDRSVRIWDLRTGAIADTIRYDHAVTALQFDSRKIVAAAGENGVKVYNRTTMEHSTLQTNGHTSPVERLRFMDRYLATGGRDATVKLWALQ
ncbi:hypothetical protein JCM8097_001205 [Rhodosporidiobolus ruineniae]